MRKIEPIMVEYIDRNVHANILSPRGVFLWAMRALVGIREVGGNNKGLYVEAIQRTIGKAEQEPWCMAAVQTCLAYAEQRLGVVSPIAASEHCMTTWRTSPSGLRVSPPTPGDIVIWNHVGTDSGHTGCVDSAASAGEFHCLEGNTEGGITPGGKVERDGGGFYLTRRTFAQQGDMKIVGFLRPFED